MNTAKKMATAKRLIAVGFLCIASSSMAQWQWIDRSGRKVFSDRPPASDIPEKNIIRRPGAPLPVTIVSNTETDTQANEPALAAPNTSAPQPSADAQKEKIAAEQKKQQEEAARRKAEDEKIAKQRAENCQRAKTALATLKTGVRLSTVDAKGERSVMDDKARATEEKRLNEAIAANCG